MNVQAVFSAFRVTGHHRVTVGVQGHVVADQQCFVRPAEPHDLAVVQIGQTAGADHHAIGCSFAAPTHAAAIAAQNVERVAGLRVVQIAGVHQPQRIVAGHRPCFFQPQGTEQRSVRVDEIPLVAAFRFQQRPPVHHGMRRYLFAQRGLHISQSQHGGTVVLNQPRGLTHIVAAPRHGERVIRAQILKIAQKPSVRRAEKIIIVPAVLTGAAGQDTGIPNHHVFQFQSAAQRLNGLPCAAGDADRHSRVIAAHGRGRSYGHRWRADLRRLAGQAADPL